MEFGGKEWYNYCMDYDLFINLFKYKATEKNTPLENFLTELFVYILKILIDQKHEKIIELFKNHFDIPFCEDDFEKINIETQREYWIEEIKCYARPDIQITIGNNVYFIEAKVDSELNQYSDIDQIQLYELIKIPSPQKNKGVRTLTKYEINTKSEKFNPKKHKVFWRQIYKFINDCKFNTDQILKENFLSFLRENNMDEKNRLVISENGLENYYALYGFLHDNLLNFAIKNSFTDKAIVFAGGEDYFGFNIENKKKPCIWIGCYREDPKNIVVESWVEDIDKLLKQLNKRNISIKDYGKSLYNGNKLFGKMPLSDLIQGNTYEKQVEIFMNWLDKNSIADIANESYFIKITEK